MWSRRAFTGVLATSAMAAVSSFGPFGSAHDKAFADENTDQQSTSSQDTNERVIVDPYATPTLVDDGAQSSALKRVLVVVDYQVDFVDGGVFGHIEPAVAIEDALCAKIDEYNNAGDIVIYTMDTHPSSNYASTREGQVNVPHCIPGQPGWEVYGAVRDRLTPEKAIMVRKGTYGSAELPFVIDALRTRGIQLASIEFAGVSTTCRVLHNAIICYNFFPELPIIFDDSTTASYTDERTVGQLDELESWGFIVHRTNERLVGVEGTYT